MAEKKHVYKAEVMALPPIKMVLGEIPSPDPKSRHPIRRPGRETREAVTKLIGFLKEEDNQSGYM
ncbi:MAG: hypothetical protein JXB85_09360 [Anaerolineales bacterium]|nr:hypothetical protein [Anaerolineales bacterium]